MSIIKRKAGSEDIVKSVLEFDEVPTEGSPNLVESGSVAQALANGGKIAVFECTYNQDTHDYVYPTADELNAAKVAGKLPIIVQISSVGGHTYFVAAQMTWYANIVKFRFVDAETGAMLKLEGPESNPVWSTGFTGGVMRFGGDKTESDIGFGLAIGSGNSVTKLTLTTAQALTVLANVGVPNFALEIDNTGNSNDVTVTVKDSTGKTTLNPSYSGGTKCYAGKFYQLTCVGTCWNITEYFAE